MQARVQLKFKRDNRRRRHQSAWITLHGAEIECSLTNLSQGGAQIVVHRDTELPDRFSLSLVPNVANKRSCEVIWRQGRTMGLKFID
jgi:PilZ domain